MDALNDLQRQLGAPVVSLVQQYWAFFALAAVGIVLWLLGIRPRQVMRGGWTVFPDEHVGSRGIERDLGLRGPDGDNED